MAIALMVEGKKGISAAQVVRHIGVTYKTAWYMCHRIREAMQEDASLKMGGPDIIVEMDEIYVGGRTRLQGCKKRHENKTAVIGIAERNGRVLMEAVDSAGLKNMRTMFERVDLVTTAVVTDGKPLYCGVIPTRKHIVGVHCEELKTRNFTSTATVEGAFSLFKRGVVGSYHKLSVEHLNRYLSEFCWRYNRRGMQPWDVRHGAGESDEDRPSTLCRTHLEGTVLADCSFSGRGLGLSGCGLV